MEGRYINYLALFASTSTLICCALPAFFVILGAGATLASLIENVPQLVVFSKHKGLITSIAFVILIISGMINRRVRSLPCPIDQKSAKICMVTRKRTRVLYMLSVTLFLIGLFVAYIIPYTLNLFAPL